ncbi:MAG: SDR family oxidoreductase [Saprospiraceae bacterium]|nr:SDR family oxidoreductase [Candidatus Parvibacillus calidus]MCO6470621.1 SDR family oxidoreductase [Saprospiraceae bacterium]WKZ64495.1 MAG: SDR family oxidoreductase [Saprospiraceae bacterium]
MKIVVFGASGPTGQEVVKQALKQDIEVTAIVRQPEKFNIKDSKLDLVQGDVFVSSSYEEALFGKDVVISCLGIGRSFRATTIYSKGGKNIISAMRKAGVKKFICLTSAGLEDNDPSFEFIYKLIFKPLLKKPYSDMKLLESYLQSVTDINWIAVRPSQLTNSPMTGGYRVSPLFTPHGGSRISRADLAHFILKQLYSDEWHGKTPTISY